MSACAQLVIAFLLILLQLGIIVSLLIIEPPQVCLYVLMWVIYIYAYNRTDLSLCLISGDPRLS